MGCRIVCAHSMHLSLSRRRQSSMHLPSISGVGATLLWQPLHRNEKCYLVTLQEIGLGTVERCKGFTAHLMKMLVKQRSSLTALTEQWIILRYLDFGFLCTSLAHLRKESILTQKRERQTVYCNNSAKRKPSVHFYACSLSSVHTSKRHCQSSRA